MNIVRKLYLFNKKINELYIACGFWLNQCFSPISRLISENITYREFWKFCFQSKILKRLSYQWTLGFISNFSRFWGLSVKIKPTERLWQRSHVIKEYDNISLSVIFHRYHYLISKNRPISRCEQVRKNRYHERKAHVTLSMYWNFHRKNLVVTLD